MPEETSSNYSKKKPSKWTENKIGVFWTKKSADGSQYLSGKVEIDGKEIPICIFKNQYSNGNTPHFQAFKTTQSNKE